jgi:hypothetical protein
MRQRPGGCASHPLADKLAKELSEFEIDFRFPLMDFSRMLQELLGEISTSDAEFQSCSLEKY